MIRKIAIATVLGALTAVAPGVQAQRGSGRVLCEITENGGSASGTVTLRSGGRTVGSGPCGEALSVPAGSYEAVVQLDGALDRPEQRRRVTVAAGATERVTADFSTAILEVRITAGGRRAAGMAIITRNGQRIGTLGSGVSGHLSAGTYDVVIRYRTEERRFDGVTLARGQRRALSAAF